MNRSDIYATKNVTPMGLNDDVFKTIINKTENTSPSFFHKSVR